MPTVPQAIACAAILTAAAFASQLIPHEDALTAASGWLLRLLSFVSWVFAISVWHVSAQHRAGERQHRQMLKKVRRLSCRIGTVEGHVGELSRDRAQAAAVVTRLFKEPRS